LVNILIAEDEPQLIGILEFLFKDEGYNITKAYDGDDAIKSIRTKPIDLVLLDIMLPKTDGFRVLEYIKKNTSVPVVILSAKKENEDKIRGLETGAEDYITKPFNHRELLLRIKKIIDRSMLKRKNEILSIGNMSINPSMREVIIDGSKIDLTPTEFNILHLVAKNEGKVLSWESIFDEIWGYKEWEGGKEIVKINIYRLRQKIESDPSDPKYLLTVRGIGYRISSLAKSN
jgi:DNA-binding response OmpR family regulator